MTLVVLKRSACFANDMQSRPEPFPHVIIDDFLPDDLFVELCEALEKVTLERKEADLFQFEQTADLSDTQDPVLKKLQKRLLGLKEKIGEQFEVVLTRLDMFAAFYYDTDYLLPHDDRLESRKVAYTFYVAAPEAGGDLLLLESQPPKKHRIRVIPNRLVLFLVEQKSLHEVEEVRGELPRISVSGWFH